MSTIILDRTRIDHAAACEGEAGLPLQPGNFVGDTEPQRMRAIDYHGFEHGIGVELGHRAERDTPFRGCDLDHRLQPIQPARAGSHDLDVDAALVGRQREYQRDFIGADGDGARIA
jgi:hypothetical protein